MAKQPDTFKTTSLVHRQNKIHLLELIRTHGTISRAVLAKLSGLTPPTVARAMEELIHQEQLVEEAGHGESKGGRRPALVRFAGEHKRVIGIDLGRTSIRGVLSDLNARILGENQVPTSAEMGFEKIVEKVALVCNTLIREADLPRTQVRGVGLAISGLVNHKEKTVDFAPDLGWHRAPLHEALENQLMLPVVFDNITRVMALGEFHNGVGTRYKHFAFITVGSGIGGGLIVNGVPFYGADGMAGELGHITVDQHSTIQCSCGKKGCLEAVASGKAIANAARREIESGTFSLLRAMCHNNLSNITGDMVAQSASQGDHLSIQILTEAAEHIGHAIAYLVNLMNPQAVVLGGGVSQAGNIFLDTVRLTVRNNVIPRHAHALDILPATHGKNATMIGAVSLIIQELLNLNLE